ncbi:Gfo/Idh/MocA family oxidoreductase [Leifsonia sp. TF02-11]|nr:Gfo/Idh/MocA family oxidoreductase [Leifsonia sp. TF02-11]
MRVVIAGYGAGGRSFHAPFIDAVPDLKLVGVVTRSAERRAQLAADRPGVPAYDDLTSALPHADLAVITTPPETRRQLVLEAVAAGVSVVADKPFAPDAATARELRDAAAAAGVPLAVFHNRRWDADVRTLRRVIESDAVGDVWRFGSRFDADDPGTLEATPGGGLLRDIGSHLVDQALWLFGPAHHVYAELDWVPVDGGRVDAGFTLALTHNSGVRSLLTSSKINHAAQRELRVLGSQGSYRSNSADVQAEASLAGLTPASEGDRWGYEPEDHWGELRTASGTEPVPSAQGDYRDYYARMAAAVRGNGPVPVTPQEAVDTLEVLDAARLSDAESQVVTLEA